MQTRDGQRMRCPRSPQSTHPGTAVTDHAGPSRRAPEPGRPVPPYDASAAASTSEEEHHLRLGAQDRGDDRPPHRARRREGRMIFKCQR
jgi:hypothetical protein